MLLASKYEYKGSRAQFFESQYDEKFLRSHHKKTKGATGLVVALEKAHFSRNLAQVALLNSM